MAGRSVVKAIVAFVERGQGKNLVKAFATGQIKGCLQCMGRGTASSELLDVLGLGTSERDIVIGFASAECVENMIYRLDTELRGQLDAHGIIFDLNVTGINRRIATVLLRDVQDGAGSRESTGNRESGGSDMEQTENSLILITVNQGHTDAVMATAREAGAAGGTIIRARWAGEKDASQFHGISVQQEKEIIAIVASKDKRNTIMDTINLKHGLNSPACAMICSLGIHHILRG